jgi:uncharacterized glyoxalase superfamily protein PhnB
MAQRVTPMIHVPDVRKAVDWYTSIGFSMIGTGEDDGEVVWAELSFGDGRLMFSAGGRPSAADGREVDLYVHIQNVDEKRRQLEGRAEIREDLHDTFYGMREFIIRDLNGFWITFGEPVASSKPRD